MQFLGVPPPPQFMREWTLREVTEATESCQLKPYPGPPDTGGTVQTIRIAYTLRKAMLFTPDQLQVRIIDIYCDFLLGALRSADSPV